MGITRANTQLLKQKPFVTNSSYREFTGTLLAGSNSIILAQNINKLDEETVLVILDGVIQLDFTISNNTIQLNDTVDKDCNYKVMIGVMLQKLTKSKLTSMTKYIIGVNKYADGNTSGTWYNVDYEGRIFKPDPNYFNNHPIYSNIKEVIIDGQYMIRIPKFYIKNNDHSLITISPTKLAGFRVHPAFMKSGVEMDYFYIGKYEGYIDSNNKLCSIPGVLPTTNKLYNEILTSATNRSNFDLLNIYQISAIQLLFLIEYKTTDAVNTIGSGNNSGTTTNSGVLKTTNDAAVITANYRGIIGLWGNTWEVIQGLQIDVNNKIQIFDNKGNKSLVNTDIILPVNSNTIQYYPIMLLTDESTNFNFKDIFLMKSGSTTATAGSYSAIYFGNVASKTCYCQVGGGYLQLATATGIFNLGFNFTPDTTAVRGSGRLSKI
jgi:hypothetical protein